MFAKPHEEDIKPRFPCHPFGENDALVEQVAEQLAVLLWKTWLHKKTAVDRENKMESHPKQPSTAF